MKIRALVLSAVLVAFAGVSFVCAESKEGVELGKVIEATITKTVDTPQIGKNGFATIGKDVEVYIPYAKKGEKYKIIVKDVVKNPATGKMEAKFDRVYDVKEGVELFKVIEVTINSEYLNTYSGKKSGLVVIGNAVEVYIQNAKIGEKYKIIVKAIEVSAFSGKLEAEFDVIK